MDDASQPATTGLPLDVPGIADLVYVARGGSGTVYRGHQVDLGRDVAVKLVPPGPSPDAVDRWRRELQAMGRLSNHPNITAVYSSGVTGDGAPYLVMPFMPDGSVGDRLRRSGPLPPAEVAAMGAKLAGALAAAHRAGVLHRDVKPDNVLISPYGEPQLTDFGIARLLDTTATTTVAGLVRATIAYAAPEVVQGAPATERSDVYGLGATLHAALTGGPPFTVADGAPLHALALRVATEQATDLRALGVPEPLADVIDRAMAKDPSERTATAEDLRRQLEAVLPQLAGSAVEGDDTVAFAPLADTVSAAAAQPDPRPVAVSSPERVLPPPMRRSPSTGGRNVVLALLALLVVAAAVLVVLASGRNGDRVATDDAGDTATSTTAGARSATTARRAATPTTAKAAAADPSTVAGATRTYLDLLRAGDYDAAYAMLSPGLQSAQNRGGYERFWRSVAPIEVLSEPQVSDLQSTVLLRLGGKQEQYTLTFVRGRDGSLLVDGPRPR